MDQSTSVISRGFCLVQNRELENASQVVMRRTPIFGYSADRVLGRPGMLFVAGEGAVRRFGLLSPFKYDVLHYYFGQSFLYRNASSLGLAGRLPLGPGFEDLRIAKRLGRKIFMTLQGCDCVLRQKQPEKRMDHVRARQMRELRTLLRVRRHATGRTDFRDTSALRSGFLS